MVPDVGVLSEQLLVLSHALEGDIGSKRLIEPEVVPPGHGAEVAKPLMAELVKGHIDEAHIVRLTKNSSFSEVILSISDASNILHCSELELRAENLIILFIGEV